VEGLVNSQDPEDHTADSVATGKTSFARQIKGEEPD